MQNIEVNDAILTTKKAKCEIMKELEDYIAKGKKNENTEIQQMAANFTANEEDVVKVIQEFEEIIRNKKSDIVWPDYYQGKIFQRLRSKERFADNMVSNFKVSKSTILLKIALSRLIDDYPKNKGLFAVASLFKKT